MPRPKYMYIIIRDRIGDADFRDLCKIVGIYGNYDFSRGVFRSWIYSDEKISKLTSILDILGCSYDAAYSKEEEEPIWR